MFLPRVLIVDDAAERAALERTLPRDHYVCELAPSAADGLGRLDRVTFDVVVAEVRVGGFALLDRVKRERPSLPVILTSAAGGVQEAVDAIKRGACHYLDKPCDELELRTAIDGAIAARRRSPASPSDGVGLLPARDEHAKSRPPPSHVEAELIGSGPAMSKLRETIELAAASNAPVLVTGESGAGKELVARAIHARSQRRGRPFVAVNASAIPADLLEAEVFGHARGGFTGAAQARKGLVMEASGGTLLLDEIGDMQLGLQAKLLRVLQFGEVRPVGSDHVQHVDVRVIAATHRDLPALIREGRFREDLYFRLDVLPIVVPPLRERREDIPELIVHLLANARQRSPTSPVQSIAPDALDVLCAAPWPGNVRELASVIERLVVFGREERIEARHLSLLSSGSSPPPPAAWMGPPTEARWTLRRLTQEYTERVLMETGGNKQRAAEILDVDLSTLYRWQRSRKGSRREAPEVVEDAGPAPSSTGARQEVARGRNSTRARRRVCA